jgi:hypothetical protein
MYKAQVKAMGLDKEEAEAQDIMADFGEVKGSIKIVDNESKTQSLLGM